MSVTNKQAEAYILCAESGDKCPAECPFYGADDCNDEKAFEVDYAKALLESRAQNAERLEALKGLLEKPFDTNCYCKMCNGKKDTARAAIAKMEEGE